MGGVKRILIIDDAVFQSEVLREVFINELGDKVEVEISKSYEDSEELILGLDFDLILIDYLLGPTVTAIDFKSKLILETESKAKWVLLSALDVVALEEKHGDEGFAGFVHKSDYRVVSDKVKEVLFPFD
tara:strand:+ start:561 stop:947 length:387 start_codon:yes stop_codon:yes gene_type:complete